MKNQVELRPWADLPSEILSCIASKLSPDAALYVSLRRVCRAWRSSLTDDSPTPSLPSSQLPFLLIPPQIFPNPSIGSIFRIPVFTNFLSPKPIDDLPQLANTRNRSCICVGSSHGWLITLHETSSVSLLNPVTADSISLEPLSSIDDLIFFHHPPRYYLISKGIWHDMFSIVHLAVLSSDPAEDPDFTLLLFISGLTACCFTCRGRDHKWISHNDLPFLMDVEDVLFINGVFVAFVGPSYLIVFDFRNHQAGLVLEEIILDINAQHGEVFLVKFDGHLVVVLRRGPLQAVICTDHQFTTDGGDLGFRFMIEPSDVALFLCHGCSVAISKQHFPWLTGTYHLHVANMHLQHTEGEDIYNKYLTWFDRALYQHIFCGEMPIKTKVFDVEKLRPSDFWRCWKFFWVTPNLRRLHIH